MDADTWLWLWLPLFATLAGAFYSAKRDHDSIKDHEDRLRKLEACEAHRQGSESGSSSGDTIDLGDLVSRVINNSQAIRGIDERLETVEEKSER